MAHIIMAASAQLSTRNILQVYFYISWVNSENISTIFCWVYLKTYYENTEKYSLGVYILKGCDQVKKKFDRDSSFYIWREGIW